ncbi:MAG: hypothetical protein HY350_04010 [Candidatus Omnitrophica bacterium]|nr:hypothetical protein [Candidatus Omnitrophota bacterium]
MIRNFVFLSILTFLAGCNPAPQNKQILAKINNYEITLDEFDEEFKGSGYDRNGTLDTQKDFLNNLINRKLILQDAQKKGLDKDKGFLRMIERFWEQSLLKLAIDKKTRETAGSALVTDKEIEDAYNNLVKEGKADKAYDQMYQQIKWEITRSKETKALNEWVAQLHKKADIKVNYDLLKQDKSR